MAEQFFARRGLFLCTQRLTFNRNDGKIDTTFTGAYTDMEAETKSLGSTMASDVLTCSLLRTLAASKPSGKFLELGTGTGLATSWILEE
ncbi:MAG TPA: hypothetical protein VGI82_03980 [Chitinophagaceae bacterium]|jgi:predicted O-methyltransferase YrrM